MTHIIKLIAVLVFIILLLNAWLYFQQPYMTFYPSSVLQATPENWQLEYEDVVIKTADNNQLHGWYVPAKKANKTIVIFHGNAGNKSHRGETIRNFHKLGANIFIFDYRGYGNSTGTPSEQGFYRDANAIWQHLSEHRKLTAKQIILFGRSLGGAVAVDLASKHQPAGLILESTFSSAQDMAHVLLPFISNFIILRYQFNSIGKISSYKGRLLQMHSPNDEIIPFTLGQRLYEAAGKNKLFYRLKGGHNGGFITSQPQYSETLSVFLHSIPTD